MMPARKSGLPLDAEVSQAHPGIGFGELHPRQHGSSLRGLACLPRLIQAAGDSDTTSIEQARVTPGCALSIGPSGSRRASRILVVLKNECAGCLSCADPNSVGSSLSWANDARFGFGLTRGWIHLPWALLIAATVSPGESRLNEFSRGMYAVTIEKPSLRMAD